MSTSCLKLMVVAWLAWHCSLVTSSASTDYHCSTSLGPFPVAGSVPTSTVSDTTVHESDVVLVKTTRFSAIVGKCSTAVTTSTSTVTDIHTYHADKAIQVYTTTVTTTATLPPFTITKTSFTGVKSTVSTTTTQIIPTPSGFIPIVNSTGLGSQKAQAKLLRARQGDLTNAIGPPWLHRRYPQAVFCTGTVHSQSTRYSTSTAPISSIPCTAKPSTSTVIATTTVQSNFLIRPSAKSILVTYVSTSTVTASFESTTTTTRTTTDTIYMISTSSSYAACATNNLLTSPLKNGGYIAGVLSSDDDSAGMYTNSTERSAYDCCVSCQKDSAHCRWSYFYAGCFLSNAGTSQCQPGSNHGAAVYHMQSSGQVGVLSNGPCGSLKDGGSV